MSRRVRKEIRIGPRRVRAIARNRNPPKTFLEKSKIRGRRGAV